MAGRVRQPIDLDAFQKYLESNVPQIKTPIQLRQFKLGQSNPTYQVIAADGSKCVLRKRPPGKLISKHSHRVEREYQVLRALERTDIPAPKTISLCMDDSIIGTPFYLMEFVEGRIFEDITMGDVSPEERNDLWKAAVQAMAELHSVDPADIGLENYGGKTSGFYNRQVRTWEAISRSQAKVLDAKTNTPVGQLPYFDETVSFFKREGGQPTERLSLVHGDFKLDNLVFHPTEPRVIAILDWESSTIGHPLSDVCQLAVAFYVATRPETCPYDMSCMLPGRTPGMPQPPQLLSWYAESCEYNPAPDMNWGMAFNIFKSAVICHGVAARMANEQNTNSDARYYAAVKGPLAELAWTLTREAHVPRAML